MDFRIRREEKEYLISQGFNVILNSYNLDLYDEIASHVDIECVNVLDNLVTSPRKFEECREEFGRSKVRNIISGNENVSAKYPKDIAYNVCVIGNKAVHNFDYTDDNLKKLIQEKGYECINVKQGYANCSTVVIDEMACITSDAGMAKNLIEHGVDALFVSEPGIKLLKRTNANEMDQERMFFEYSNMNGFIGGAMVLIDDTVVIFGDVEKLLNKDKIIDFITKKGKKIRDFKGLDIIDYGGIVTF